MAEAPICHVSLDQVIPQPPPVKYPSIPLATDLKSALAAINAIRQIMISITESRPSQGARWAEAARTVKRVRVENPDDKSQFVEIDRIERLVMRDAVTGQVWDWRRGR